MAELSPGGTCISAEQRRVHVVAEALAVVLVAPLLGYVATRPELPDWARVGAGAAAVGTLLVDGWLLSRYLDLGGRLRGASALSAAASAAEG